MDETDTNVAGTTSQTPLIEFSSPVDGAVVEVIVPEPLEVALPESVEVESALQPILLEPTLDLIPHTPASTAPSLPSRNEPEIVERIIERVVEKEVIKEVPVERIVEKIIEVEKPVERIIEKIVYREPEPLICPPPTNEEIAAIHQDFLIDLSKQGTAKKHELMIEKLADILTLFDTKQRIMHKDVMALLGCSTTTATRLLTELRHENIIVLHGTKGNGATYTKV